MRSAEKPERIPEGQPFSFSKEFTHGDEEIIFSR
jgi:hypothetical protein